MSLNLFWGKINEGIPLFLPTIVVMEFLSFPVLRPRERIFFSNILSKLQIIPLDFEIAEKAAFLRQKYNTKLGDSVVAATAWITKSTLITRDIKHFQKVKEIKLEAI